jgi:hypothetical protein
MIDRMDMGHDNDMVVDTGIHHTWRSHDLNNERLWGGRLCADHVPGGVMIKLGERSCSIMRASRNTLRCGRCFEKISQYQRIRIRNLSRVHRMRADMRQQP